jgi:serine/threonine-protein kinase RIM15
MCLLTRRLSIEDFEIIQGLSAGGYAQVCLVKKLSSGDYFAMKMIDKERTFAKAQEEYIASEISIMRDLNSDYVVKLYYSFQTQDYLCFVMDYMNGGDLGNLLQLLNAVEEKVSCAPSLSMPDSTSPRSSSRSSTSTPRASSIAT